MKKLKNVRSNKITIICMILLISLFSIFTPMATFCVDNATVEISEDLNNSIIDELNEIDFSDLNGVIEEFQNNSTNIFSIDNIKAKYIQSFQEKMQCHILHFLQVYFQFL